MSWKRPELDPIRFFYAFLAGGILLGGCGLLAGSDDEDEVSGWAVRPGAIVFYGDTSAVELSADTVRVGQPLRVSATTFGGGCTRAAGMRTGVRGLQAALTPLDSVYTPGPNEGCDDILIALEHSVEVAFERAGEARVVIRGVEQGPGTRGSEEVRLERTVVVVE